MKIKWLGHACFLITSQSGLKIITDPYEAGFRDMISYGPVKESPDIVTISHQHGDHNYTGDLQGNPEIVQEAGKHKVKGIEFTGTPCYHDRVSGKQRGNNTIFNFTLDNIQVCHCGDLGHPLDNSVLQTLGHVDLLLIPTGGPEATLDLDEALVLCEKIKPSVIIPMHFRNQKCIFPKYDIDELVKLRPSAVKSSKNEAEFTAGQLPTSQILILEPSL
ncbi:MAG: MBL fold metallo-hydrolase [Dehalococcoidales bacterium]|nr:MBL fold metallo-hydrolase [Dehalococcoidales bacterium]